MRRPSLRRGVGLAAAGALAFGAVACETQEGDLDSPGQEQDPMRDEGAEPLEDPAIDGGTGMDEGVDTDPPMEGEGLGDT